MNRKQRRASAKLGPAAGNSPGPALTALLNTGLKHLQANQLGEAEACLRQVLASRPDNADALHLLGVIALRVGRLDVAVDLIGFAVRQDGQNPLFFSNLGLALFRQGRFDDALACYDKALALKPDFAEVLNNRGNTLQKLKRYDAAVASYDMALAIMPNFTDALNNRGVTQYEAGRIDAALADYDRAIAILPSFAEAFYNRGNALQKRNRFDDAITAYDTAIAHKPDYAEAFTGLGVALKELRRTGEALASYDRALAINPGYAEAHWNEAIVRLLTGDFEQGWVKSQWRRKSESLGLQERDFAQPLWLGAEPVTGKTILLHSDEGLGDTIHFCRYAPSIAALGARVIVEVEDTLQPLVSDVAGVSQCVSKGEPLPDFDLHCPLSSLPLALGTRLETIPSATPYLHAPADTYAWEAQLGPADRPRVGLVWSGNPQHKNDHNRSIPLEALSPLFDISATFVSLQKDIRADDLPVLRARDNILDLGPSLRNFTDTAAVVSRLDLVISVDTSVVHLAGALGRPVWILLPFVPDWRWLLDRDDSPWYPTARLFRQSDDRDWDCVMGRVRNALSALVDNR